MKHILKFTTCFLIAAIVIFSCKKEVTPATKKSPIANAGNTRVLILPINSVDLTGIGTDVDGQIVSYAWRYVSGPPLFTISNPGNANANVKNMVRGIYEFELKVIDNDGFFATDKTFVLVLDSINDPLNEACMGCWD